MKTQEMQRICIKDVDEEQGGWGTKEGDGLICKIILYVWTKVS